MYKAVSGQLKVKEQVIEFLNTEVNALRDFVSSKTGSAAIPEDEKTVVDLLDDRSVIAD
jgi:hypothetical protein